MTDTMDEAATIAAQNDEFRAGLGGQTSIPGKVVMTAALADRDAHFQQRAAQAVWQFKEFTEDNDPWRQHDFGAFEIDGEKLFWKIDLYDTDYQYGSEIPTNTETTRRVLTIMFASDY